MTTSKQRQLLWIYGKVPDVNPKMSFPEDFLFGVSTAAYQIEGAWNADGMWMIISIWYAVSSKIILRHNDNVTSGKGENIWDRLVHTDPDQVRNKANGDVACDSYHLFREDIACIKEVGVRSLINTLSFSRFSFDNLALFRWRYSFKFTDSPLVGHEYYRMVKSLT